MARSILVKWRHRGLTANDLIVAGFPKSGSTWLRFMLVELLTGESPRTFADVDSSSPMIGNHATAPRIVRGEGRLIKSHEPYDSIALRHPRAVYILRDPRDIAVSLYHYIARMHVEWTSFDSFLDAFSAGTVLPYGSWGSHVKSWYDASRRAPSRIALIRYEDLLTNPPEALRVTLEALTVHFPACRLDAAIENNTADAMRSKEAATPTTSFPEGMEGRPVSIPFVRSATAGQWRAALTRDQESRIVEAFSAAMRLAGYSPG